MKWLWILPAGLYAFNASGQELSYEWDWTVSASSTQHQDSVLLGESPRHDTQALDALLDVEVSGYDWTALLAAKGSNILSNDSSARYDAEFVVQELFWQGEATLFELPIDLTAGKLRLDWGVGYGYRPLDIFKPYRRNPVGIQVEEGALIALGSYFDLQGEWSLVASDSSFTQQSGSKLEKAAEQTGIGFRRYALEGENEWQFLAYYDNVRHGLVGASFVSGLDPSWAVHSSALYQHQYLTYQPNAWDSPVTLETDNHGYQFLLGLNWANAVGNNIIVEYWYDSRSWNKNQWERAFERAEFLHASDSTRAFGYSYAQGLESANLVQHNLLFHWTLDSNAWSHWQWSNNLTWLNHFTPTVDVMYSPQDGGLIATQWLDYQAYDSGNAALNIEMAVRFMTGESDSVYATLSDKSMIFINLKGRF